MCSVEEHEMTRYVITRVDCNQTIPNNNTNYNPTGLCRASAQLYPSRNGLAK